MTHTNKIIDLILTNSTNYIHEQEYTDAHGVGVGGIKSNILSSKNSCSISEVLIL